MSSNVWAAWYRCLLDVHEKRQTKELLDSGKSKDGELVEEPKKVPAKGKRRKSTNKKKTQQETR